MKSHTSLAYHLRTLYARHAGDPAATRAARPPTRDRVIHKNGEVSSVSDEAIAVAAMRELRGIAAERGDDGTAGTRSTPKRQQKRPAAAAASPRASPRASSKRARRDEENARPLVAASRAPSFFFRDVAGDADGDADADRAQPRRTTMSARLSRDATRRLAYDSRRRRARRTPPPSRPLRPAPPAPDSRRCRRARAVAAADATRRGGIGDVSGAAAASAATLSLARGRDRSGRVRRDDRGAKNSGRARRGAAVRVRGNGRVGRGRGRGIRDQVRSIHWSPYDRVRVVNADP